MAPRRIGADANDYYDSTLGEASKLSLTTTTVASAKLPEGRYLLILRADAGVWAWVKPRQFDSDAGTLTADVPATPLSPDGIISVEFNVREDRNQIRGVTESGTATLYIIPISATRTPVESE